MLCGDVSLRCPCFGVRIECCAETGVCDVSALFNISDVGGCDWMFLPHADKSAWGFAYLDISDVAGEGFVESVSDVGGEEFVKSVFDVAGVEFVGSVFDVGVGVDVGMCRCRCGRGCRCGAI